MKTSRIIPIHKGGNLNKMDPKSYRPVNIISPISKLIERVWVNQINLHLKNNKIIDQNHQGSIKTRNGSMIINEILQNVAFFKKENKSGAIISLDQSAAYDLIPHSILKLKLRHIGLSESSTKILMSFLANRKQYVQINSNKSDVLLTGDKSVSQGSVASGLLYLIYTLDMPHISHKLKHKNHLEYNKCRNNLMNTYVDDCFTIIISKKKNLWNKIKKYIIKMNNYYTNNKLQMNVKKLM